jgi:O-antigen/teichoic acid export membrane protein
LRLVQPADADEQLDASVVRRRARHGVVLLSARSVFLKLVGAASVFVLAKLLGPAEFGLIALAFTMQTLGGYLSDFGMGGTLIRQAAAPTLREVGTNFTFQLLFATIVTTATAVVTVFAFSADISAACTLGALAVLTGAFRNPPAILLERELAYPIIARAEVIESLAYTVGSLIVAAVGLGGIGVAAVLVLRPLVGAVVMLSGSHHRLPPLGIDMTALRGQITVGAQLGLGHLMSIGRDQGIALGVGAIGGLPALGAYYLTTRLVALPGAAFELLQRVTFPVFARLLPAGVDVSGAVCRAVGLGGDVLAPILVLLTAATQGLLPLVLGDEWAPVRSLMPFVAATAVLVAPVTLVTSSLLTAGAHVTTALRLATVAALAALLGGLAGTALAGPLGLGIGLFVGGLMEMRLMVGAVHRVHGIELWRQIVPPGASFLVATVVAAGVASVTTSVAVDWLLPAAAVAMYLTTRYAVDRAGFRDSASYLRRLVTERRGRPAA